MGQADPTLTTSERLDWTSLEAAICSSTFHRSTLSKPKPVRATSAVSTQIGDAPPTSVLRQRCPLETIVGVIMAWPPRPTDRGTATPR
jgi:hypothetical protein